MKNPMIGLVIGIPAVSILMGVVTIFLAFGDPDQEVRRTAVPLNKVSWQAEVSCEEADSAERGSSTSGSSDIPEKDCVE